MARHRGRTHSQLDIAHRDQEGEPHQELTGEPLDPAEPGPRALAWEAVVATRHHARPELATEPGLLSDFLGCVLPVGVGDGRSSAWVLRWYTSGGEVSPFIATWGPDRWIEGAGRGHFRCEPQPLFGMYVEKVAGHEQSPSWRSGTITLRLGLSADPTRADPRGSNDRPLPLPRSRVLATADPGHVQGAPPKEPPPSILGRCQRREWTLPASRHP